MVKAATSLSRRAVLAGVGAVGVGVWLEAARAAPARPEFPDTGWLPFSEEGGLIRFRGAINGAPANLLLDSGCGATVIDAGFARKVGVGASGRTQTVQGMAQSRATTWTQAYTLTLGAAPLRMSGAVEGDLAPLAHLGGDTSAIIGGDLLDFSLLDIDIENRRLAFRSSARVKDRPALRTDLMPAPGRLRKVQLSLGGRSPTWAIFDLGSMNELSLDNSYAQAAGLLRGRPTSTWVSVGVEGDRTSTVATLPHLSIAGVGFAGVPVAAMPDWNPSTGAPANVGYPVFSRMSRVMVDYGSNSLYLAPPRKAPAPFAKNRLGIALDPAEHGWKAVHIAPASPAALQGWRTGDRIASINGATILSYAERRDLAQGPAGEAVRFAMADGSKRTLVLADYY